jgi:hypothetical protein
MHKVSPLEETTSFSISIIRYQTGTKTSFSANFGDKLSFILSFLFPERLHCNATYMLQTCTTTMITLEPCALNAEFRKAIRTEI